MKAGVRDVATLTIRDLDPNLKTKLRIRAAQHGRSMEAEVRAILASELGGPTPDVNLGSRIRLRFAKLHGLELELPARTDPPRAAKV
jgi:antitoxin FitA